MLSVLYQLSLLWKFDISSSIRFIYVAKSVLIIYSPSLSYLTGLFQYFAQILESRWYLRKSKNVILSEMYDFSIFLFQKQRLKSQKFEIELVSEPSGKFPILVIEIETINLRKNETYCHGN